VLAAQEAADVHPQKVLGALPSVRRGSDRGVPMTRHTRTQCSANQQMVADLLARDYVFNIPCLLRAAGELRADRLRDALQALVERHEILRCPFVLDGGVLFQESPVPVTVEVAEVDVRSAEAPLDAARTEIARECRQPFAPAEVPRLRACVYQLDACDYVVSIIVDHLAADGAALAILLADLRFLYQVIDGPTPYGFPPPAPQYREFARWQRAWLGGSEAEAQRAFWRDHLANLSAPAGGTQGSTQRQTVPFTLPGDATTALASLCVRHMMTPFMAILAAYAPLLSAGTGERDLVVGTVRANRRHAEAEGMVGHFANLIPIRLHVEPDWSWRRFFAYVRETCRACYVREELPFADIAAAARAAHGIGGTRLTECIINFVPMAGAPVGWGDGLRMSQLWGLPVQGLPATGRISLFVCQQQSELSGTLVFDPASIDPAWATALPARLAKTIARAVREPEETVSMAISSE
jgi:hypothetical protein